MRAGTAAGLVAAALVAAGCGPRAADESRGAAKSGGESAPAATEAPAPAAAAPAARFVDVAKASGLSFTHNTGAFGSKWLPETMGSGCAWLDYDGDGDPDALLLSGADFPGHPTGRRGTPGLFRNDAGTFTDVTAAAGLAEPGYAVGVCVGDYDEDGDPDVYLTMLGPNRLYDNEGGRFREVGAARGVADAGFGSSAAWVDYDGDADLDLFALNYVRWSPETDIFCSLDGTNKSYCTPEAYEGASAVLYRNDGGSFADVTAAAGMKDDTGKGLGVVVLDYDADGRPDLFVANDTQPNFLWHNEGDGTFTEQGLLAGVAFDEAGRARGAMGVDVADWDGSGRPGLAIGNFSNEMLSLYHNEGGGLFLDAAPSSGVGRQSLLTLAFGVVFLDFDLDGLDDLFVANGHVEDEIQKVQARVAYAQPPHLFRNVGGGRFEDVASGCDALARPMVARGCAYADYDGDGDVDLLVNTSGGDARLLRNDTPAPARSVRVTVVGGNGSARDAIGARVDVTTGGRTHAAWVRGAHSYASQSEPALTFGLGDAPAAEAVVVTFPSGRVARLTDVPAGSSVVVREETAGVPAG